MKSAIYLNEGTTQLALTPENKWEEKILRMVNAAIPDKTFWGKFYECQGGWMRHGRSMTGGFASPEEPVEDASLMIRVDKKMDDLPCH